MNIVFSEHSQAELTVKAGVGLITGNGVPVAAGDVRMDLSHGAVLLASMDACGDIHSLNALFAKAVAACRREGLRSVQLDFSSVPEKMREDAVYSAGYACTLANYAFEHYKTEPKGTLEDIYLCIPDASRYADILDSSRLLGSETCYARELTNLRSSDMTPERLCGEALTLDGKNRINVSILGPKELYENGIGGLLAVAKGAEREARLILLRYSGDPQHPGRILGIAGKALTYDSGGMSLKKNDSMVEMHTDMGGAAAALAALRAIADAGLTVNVTLAIPACENMLSPLSNRPGDIITMMNGKTVEVGNADAEGRLVLADALTFLARKEGATALLDIATLTSASLASTGPKITPYTASRNFMDAKLISASARSGELVWRMPIIKEYRRYLRSEHADMSNVSDNKVVMIAGGMFLEEFTDGLPWAHLDIGGTGVAETGDPLNPPGATGAGVALIYHFAYGLSGESV